MSDPKVPKTSDSESPTLVPQGNAKLESAPPSPDSSESPTLVDGGRGKPGASDAPTIVAGRGRPRLASRPPRLGCANPARRWQAERPTATQTLRQFDLAASRLASGNDAGRTLRDSPDDRRRRHGGRL